MFVTVIQKRQSSQPDVPWGLLLHEGRLRKMTDIPDDAWYVDGYDLSYKNSAKDQLDNDLFKTVGEVSWFDKTSDNLMLGNVRNIKTLSDLFMIAALKFGEWEATQILPWAIKAVARIQNDEANQPQYFVTWREDFDDQWGWFTTQELFKQFAHFQTLKEDGEWDGEFDPTEVRIIQGKDVTKKFKTFLER